MTSPHPGNKIRAAREAAGMSQRDLADLVECSQAYIYALEKGTRPISDEMLARLATALDVPLEDLSPDAAARRAELQDELAAFVDDTIIRLQVYKRRLAATQEPKGERAA